MNNERRPAKIAAVVFALAQVGCGPKLLPKRSTSGDLPFNRLESVPIIIACKFLGRSLEGPPRFAGWNGNEKVLLNRAAIRVETVLRGNVPAGDQFVYFFTTASAYAGPPQIASDWQVGGRYLFFLRWDMGRLRTVCDFMQRCVLPILSGPHPNFKVDSRRTMAATITDLLLARGEGCSDAQMMDAIMNTPSFSEELFDEKLFAIAKGGGSLAVSEVACLRLHQRGVKRPCLELIDPAWSCGR